MALRVAAVVWRTASGRWAVVGADIQSGARDELPPRR
jgi:hypothetical protein